MEVKAKLRYLKISPRKVRLVIDLIRGMDATEAVEQLSFVNKRAAQPVIKLINSALANAENNFQLKKETLYIKKITADEGPKLKRWKPRAFGRATQVVKRSTHLTLILEERGKKEKGDLKNIKKDNLKSEKMILNEKTVKDKNKKTDKKKEASIKRRKK